MTQFVNIVFAVLIINRLEIGDFQNTFFLNSRIIWAAYDTA